MTTLALEIEAARDTLLDLIDHIPSEPNDETDLRKNLARSSVQAAAIYTDQALRMTDD